MLRKFLIVIFLLLASLVSCVVDRFDYKVDYSNAKPVFFNIKIVNMSEEDKSVELERTTGSNVRTENDEFQISANCEMDFDNIVGIDNRFEMDFRDFRPGMFGSSTISIIVDEDRIEIGEFLVNCGGSNPTDYGEFSFPSDPLVRIKSGIVSLKLTIAEDGKLSLEYLNLDDLMAKN